jgi:hypothetical protein
MNNNIGVQEKPSFFLEPKSHLYVLDLPSLLPDLLGLLDSPSSLLESVHKPGTANTPPPSSETIDLYHLMDTPSSSLESAHKSSTCSTPSPSQKVIDLCHLLDTPSPSSESAHESDMGGTHSPSPVPSWNSNFRIPEPIPLEPQEDIGAQASPSSEPQIAGSISDPCCEFHTASSSARLTLVLAGWIWGEPAPPPIKSKLNDRSGPSKEVKCTGNSVHHAVYVLEHLLRNMDSRIVYIVTG